MSIEPLSRRNFLAGSGALTGTALLKIGVPGVLGIAATACTARDEGAAFEVLTADEGRAFEAIAARILPTTDTPGAHEAGVIYFIDKSFASIMQGSLPFARQGLASFQDGIDGRFPGVRAFADLAPNDQDRYLAARQDSPFFGLLRFMTIAGFLAMSSYGGNRDDIGWKLIGFEHRHGASQPPFGYYDAEYMRSHSDDG